MIIASDDDGGQENVDLLDDAGDHGLCRGSTGVVEFFKHQEQKHNETPP